MDNIGSREVARAAVLLALSKSREEEKQLKESFKKRRNLYCCGGLRWRI